MCNVGFLKWTKFMITNWLLETWHIVVLSAPWLLVGFFIAGIIHVVLPTGFIKRHLQTPGLLSIVKASAYGIPLPLCSCSVIPVGISLRKQGASKGATASFFVSTPEIGVDSFLLSFFLLGPVLAITRVVATICSALGVGIMVDRFSEFEDGAPKTDMPDACCGKSKEEANPDKKNSLLNTFLHKIKQVVQFAFVEIFDDIAAVLTIGFAAAGLVSVLVPANLFMDLNLSPIVMMLVMLIAALPVYVCATSSTPLVAALLAKGLDPGAAIVFLLAGPATNVTTMLTIFRELGKRELIFYLGGIITISMFFGMLVSFSVEFLPIQSYLNFNDNSVSHNHINRFPGYILAFMLSLSLAKKFMKRLR